MIIVMFVIVIVIVIVWVMGMCHPQIMAEDGAGWRRCAQNFTSSRLRALNGCQLGPKRQVVQRNLRRRFQVCHVA